MQTGSIEDLKKYLSQKKRYIEIFSQIFPDWKNRKWSLTELELKTNDWAHGIELKEVNENQKQNHTKGNPVNIVSDLLLLSHGNWRKLARIVGSEDFTQLLLLKAK